MKKEVVLVLAFLIVIPLIYSFTGSGGAYDLTVAQLSTVGVYNGSGGTYAIRITMGQVAVGNGTGGSYKVWLGYIHMLNTEPITTDAIAIHANTTNTTHIQHAYTNHTLICEVNITDLDGLGTELEINVTWFKDGIAWDTDNETITYNMTGITYNINTTTTGSIEPADTTHHETWICQVTVSDGQDKSRSNSTGFYVYNHAPDLDTSKATTVSWNEDTQKTIDLSTYFSDIDSDNLDYSIAWTSTKYGGGFFTINNITVAINNDTGIVTITPSHNITGSMYIIFNATDHNTNDNGWTNTSNMTLTITGQNDAPWATNVYIYPYSAEYSDTLSCEYTYNDIENDPEDLTADVYKWFIQNEGAGAFSQVATETAKTLTPDNFDLDDVLICSVLVQDDQGGTANSYTNSTERTIVTIAAELVETNIVIGIG